MFLLSVYAHIGPLACAYKIIRRHDQAMALWRIEGQQLTLLRYWEFERLTKIKGHGISFPDVQAARAFISALLAEEGLALEDIDEIIGTPGLLTQPDELINTLDDNTYAYHSLCHLYTGLFIDSSLFYNDKILCLALDAGPDHVLTPTVWKKHHYLAAYVNNGSMEIFPIVSPAIFWAMLREQCGLAEGTLMALGSACTAEARIEIPPAPAVWSLNDRHAAFAWVTQLAEQIDGFSEADQGVLFQSPDSRFSFKENKISMLVKIVQTTSFAIVIHSISAALQRFDVSPQELYLSMVGGLALNCPINAQLMQAFKFKGFVAPPAVNDSGMALGMGLHHIHRKVNRFEFKLGTAYHGRLDKNIGKLFQNPALKCSILSIEAATTDQIVEDIINGPVVWFDGAAEIGPRALGHRSLLADPRTEKSKDQLNHIKQREWWRPVAPIVCADFVQDWFDIKGESPFMLQAVKVRPSCLEKIPAIRHLDGTARVQTLNKQDSPLLYSVLYAFKERTGIPMLCNTSLNDKGEPIIDSLERAIDFALAKEINIAYLNGYRVSLVGDVEGKKHESATINLWTQYFTAPNISPEWLTEHNPFAMTRFELMTYFSDPRLAKYDLTLEADVLKIRHLLQIAKKRHGSSIKTLLWETGAENGGLIVD